MEVFVLVAFAVLLAATWGLYRVVIVTKETRR